MCVRVSNEFALLPHSSAYKSRKLVCIFLCLLKSTCYEKENLRLGFASRQPLLTRFYEIGRHENFFLLFLLSERIKLAVAYQPKGPTPLMQTIVNGPVFRP